MAYGMNTFLIMGDGAVKQAGEIRAGDYMLGPDSRPHKVINSTGRKSTLYKVNYVDGFFSATADQLIFIKDLKGNALTAPLSEIIKETCFKIRCCRSQGIEFPEKPLLFDPYELGLIVGNEKYLWRFNGTIQFPKYFTRNSRENRIVFLAALIDTYGEVIKDFIKIQFHDEGRARDTMFLAKSLGMTAWVDEGGALIIDSLNDCMKDNPGVLDTSQVNNISEYLYEISVEELGEEYVSSIELEDNSLMLLDDFTVVPDCSGMISSGV